MSTTLTTMRPKRSAAIACMTAIQNKSGLDDNSNDNGSECCSGCDSDFDSDSDSNGNGNENGNENGNGNGNTNKRRKGNETKKSLSEMIAEVDVNYKENPTSDPWRVVWRDIDRRIQLRRPVAVTAGAATGITAAEINYARENGNGNGNGTGGELDEANPIPNAVAAAATEKAVTGVHPSHLLMCLQIHDPPVPPRVIRSIIKAADVLTYEAIHLMAISPWLPISVIGCALDTEMYEMLRHLDGDNIFSEKRFEYFLTSCAKVLQLLANPDEHIPPKLGAVSAIVSELGMPILAATVDHKVAMHAITRDERNERYLLLILDQTSEWCRLGTWQHEEDTFYLGLLSSARGVGAHGSTPLDYIATYWSDEKAAAVFDKILDAFASISDTFVTEIAQTNFLNEAIKHEKWNLVKRVVHRAPRCLLNVNWRNTLPLRKALSSYHEGAISCPDYIELIHLMVEQGVRIAKTESEKQQCGGLLNRHRWWPYESPLAILHSKDKDAAKDLCANLIHYFASDMKEGMDDSRVNDHNASTSTRSTSDSNGSSTKSTNYNEVTIVLILKEVVFIQAWSILRYLILKWPELLHIKDHQQSLILHHLCSSSHQTPLDIIQLAIQESLRLGVGGKRGRGGISIANAEGETPLQMLSARNGGSNHKLFKYLIEAKPKLILKRDYKNFNLLHSVANNGMISVAKKVFKECPNSISFTNKNGELPIHLCCKGITKPGRAQFLRWFLKEGVKQNVGGEDGKGGLMVPDNNGVTPLKCLVKNLAFDRRVRKKTLDVLFEGIVHDVPFIQEVLIRQRTEEFCEVPEIIKENKDALIFEDINGRLPLHVIMETISQFDSQEGRILPIRHLEAHRVICDENPTAVGMIDPVTNLYPFMIAASSNDMNGLNDIYKLLRTDPSAVDSDKLREK